MSKQPLPNQAKNHLKDIILLFSVPIGVILIVIAALYIPRLFAHPTYDFIYCSGSNCSSAYDVEVNTITEQTKQTYRSYSADSSLHYYDASNDTTRRITLKQAQEYKLDPTSKSPDGYELEVNRQSGGPFTSSYRDRWSLKKGFASKPVTLNNGSSDRYYYGNSEFIGWVVSNE